MSVFWELEEQSASVCFNDIASLASASNLLQILSQRYDKGGYS
jgi:hypothetical protein